MEVGDLLTVHISSRDLICFDHTVCLVRQALREPMQSIKLVRS
jgi:hypothetical protein